LVALQYGYVHRALTRLVSFLCRQPAQARVQPTFCIYKKVRRLREATRARGKQKDSRTNRTAVDR
jgi:hypothetical protein